MYKIANLEKTYSSSFINESSETLQKKQKYYYLYKIGGKYLIRKRRKENIAKKSPIQSTNKKINLKSTISHIKSLFRYKYTKMFEYNTIIINRLIFNINCSLVTAFKENLIIYDENEYFFRFYERKKGNSLLKKIVDYYEINNIIYPNYTVLYEGNYLFNNIEQKQKIIDRLEKISKNKKEEKENDNDIKEENILNSNVIDSILNQTNTSENKRYFGLKDNYDLNEEENDELNQIKSLIKNIEKFEKKENKNKIFKKKNLIRIVNDNNNNKILKKENSHKKDNTKNNKNFYTKELLSTISYFQKSNSKFRKKRPILKDNINTNNKEFFSTTQYNKTIINRNNNYKIAKNHQRINTFDTNKIRPKNLILSNNFNNSHKFSNSPYMFKKPINMDNITYSKKRIFQNFSGRNKTSIHKNSKSINTVHKSNFLLDSDYFNLDNNYNGIKIYKKKLHKIDTDSNIENKLNYINSYIVTQSNENSKEKNNHIRNKPKINGRQLSIPTRKYISSNKNVNINLYNSKYKYNRVSPSPTFKTIAKMIKTKYLIDDKLNNKINSAYLTARNTWKDFNFKKIKNNSIKRDDNMKNDTSKNIYISNNITNNNFYTVKTGNKKNMKLIIYRNSKNHEINKRNTEKINIKEYKLDKFGNLYINTESKNQKFNNKKFSYSQNNNKKSIINPYKNGLIDSTTLKSLDIKSLNHLLNKFRTENSSYDKNLSNSNNNFKYITINEMKNKNNLRYTKFFNIV